MRKRMIAASLLALAASAPAQAQDRALREAIARDYRDQPRRAVRAFPPQPRALRPRGNTAARMAQELRALGYEVTDGVGGTGVVAMMRNGAGPTVLLRADMDGLPVEENSGLAQSVPRQADRRRRHRAAGDARLRP